MVRRVSGSGMGRTGGGVLVPHSDETKAAARAMLESGKNVHEVSDALGVPVGTIRGWISRAGWLAPQSVTAKNKLARELAAATKASAAEKWAGRWDGAREQVHALVQAALAGASLPAPKNWQELNTAVEVIRKICGVSDKAESSGPSTLVQIGIAPVSSAAVHTHVQEGDVVSGS